MKNSIVNNFNNREIALSIWVFILIVFALSKQEVRSSVLALIKVFFEGKLFLIYLLMTAYVVLLLVILYHFDYWKFTLLKETILWYFGIAFTSFVNVNKINKDEGYLKNIIKDNLKLLVVLEFIFSFYTFSIVVELFFVPIILLLSMLSGFTEVKSEYHRVKKFIDNLFVVIGLLVMIFTIYKLFSDFNSIANADNLEVFFLPPVLSFLFIPCIYIFALFVSYEAFFGRLKFFIKNKKERNYAKWKVFFTFHFRLRKFNKFSMAYFQLNQESNSDIKKAIRLFNNKF